MSNQTDAQFPEEQNLFQVEVILTKEILDQLPDEETEGKQVGDVVTLTWPGTRPGRGRGLDGNESTGE